MTEEETAIIMDRLNDYARQYAICKASNQCWDYHTEFTAVLELAAELGVVKFSAGAGILAKAVADYREEKARKEVST